VHFGRGICVGFGHGGMKGVMKSVLISGAISENTNLSKHFEHVLSKIQSTIMERCQCF